MITQDILQEIIAFELNSCIIHQHGTIKYIYEKFPRASEELLPINSCTKSFLSALICIAMEKGVFPPPEKLASDLFTDLQLDERDKQARKRQITIEHLLTMSAGFQWTEFGGSNSFPKMTRSSNWIQFVLKQPMADEPGTKWVYNSGVSQMLAGILKQVIGTPISVFAEQHLFAPLGIEKYDWKSDPQGIHTGGFGMELAAVDLVKFGLLYLQRGMWNGQNIISEELIERSVTPAIAISPPERGYYGWHWWVDSVDVPREIGDVGTACAALNYFYARGYGGQFVFVIPDCEAIVVTTREKNKTGFFPHDLFRRDIAPLLVRTHRDRLLR